MCEFCNSTPHLSGCPNEIRMSVDRCVACGDGIALGEVYYDMGGDAVCENCITRYVRASRRVAVRLEG